MYYDSLQHRPLHVTHLDLFVQHVNRVGQVHDARVLHHAATQRTTPKLERDASAVPAKFEQLAHAKEVEGVAALELYRWLGAEVVYSHTSATRRNGLQTRMYKMSSCQLVCNYPNDNTKTLSSSLSTHQQHDVLVCTQESAR